MLLDQTLDEIRQELAQTELNKTSDEEYMAMLSRHTANLVELLEQISAGKQEIPGREYEVMNEDVMKLFKGFCFLMDAGLNFVFLSDGVQEYLGYSPQELMHKSLKDYLTNIGRKALDVVMAKASKKTAGNKPVRTEVEIQHAGGDYQFFEVSVSKAKRKGLWLGLCQHIHDFRRKEELLVIERNNAELNDKLKSDFLADMSHEIRTPLNGIVGFSTMLDQENISHAKRQKYLRIIRSSSAQLLTLINDIIDHSKIEAGQLKIICNEMNVHLLLDELLATSVAEAGRLGKDKVRITKQVPRPGSEFMIISDEVRLRQVMNNLLGNALKFTMEGSVTFGYSLDQPGSIRFFVRDSGMGISPSLRKSIFKRFKQTGEGKKEQYQGTGLGLAISKGIVELMGGSIGVESKPGQGAEFFFILPLMKGESVKADC